MRKIMLSILLIVLLSSVGCKLQRSNSEMSNYIDNHSSHSETKVDLETNAVFETEAIDDIDEKTNFSLWRSEDNSIEFSFSDQIEKRERLCFEGTYRFEGKTHAIYICFGYGGIYEKNNNDFQSDGHINIYICPTCDEKVDILVGDYYIDSNNELLVVKQIQLFEEYDYAQKYKKDDLVKFHKVESNTYLYLVE